ncbi:MAG: CBU_0592 family membrane protein [Flavobacteriales bacterium]
MEALSDLTGWGGALMVLGAYFLTMVKNWKVESGRYILFTCTAAVLLIVNAALNAAWPFLVINAAMIVIAVYKIVREGWPGWK